MLKREFINTLYRISRFGKHYVNSNDSGLSVCLRNDVQMIIHRLSDVSSCSEAMNQLRLEPKLKSLSQSTATGSNDCGHTKMQ